MKRRRIWLALFVIILFAALLFVACDKEEAVSPCAEGHSFEEEIISAPTCLETGVLRRVCSVCNTARDEELPATGHTAGEWQVTIAPTCTEEGLRRMNCAACGENMEAETVPAKGHTSTGEWVVDVEPTCTKAGKRHTAACSVCGDVDIVETIVALGHAPSNWQSVSTATCTTEGVRQKTCERCRDVVKSETIGALGHVFDTWQGDTANALRVSRACARTGCDAEEEYVHDSAVRESGERTDLQLSGYSLVYDGTLSRAFQEKITELASRIYGYTGAAVSASASSNAKKTIHIQTGNDASITGHGFAIKRSGETITIIGTTALITQMGVDYFMKTYVTGATISLPELLVSDAYEMIDVSHYTVLYSATLDDRGQETDQGAGDPDGYYGVSSETGRDYAVDVAFSVAERFAVIAYPDSRVIENAKTLIGATDRVQSAIALAYLKGHEYGIMMIDGHLVLTGYSVAALHKAAPLLYDYLTDATAADGSVLLPANLCMIGEASTRWLNDEALLPTHLPLYAAEDDGEGAFQYMYRGSGVDKDAFDAYVTTLKSKGYTVLTSSEAEGSCFVTLTDAERGQLLHISYEAYAHASDNVAGGEWAAKWGSDPAIRVITAYVQETYTKKTDDVKKPSGYNSSESVKTYESGVTCTYFYYQSKPTVLSTYRSQFISDGYVEILQDSASERYVLLNKTTGEWVDIFVGGTQGRYYICRRHYAPGVITLPSSQLLSPDQSYTKVTDTKIVAIDLSAVNEKGVSGSYGTGYVIMLEDGRFVIIDGGAADGGTSGSAAFAQVENCWSILSALFQDVYGTAPTPSNPVRIAAWILTHGHGDHMGMFWDFCHRYGGGSGKHTLGAYAQIEYLLANSADFTTLYNTGEPNMGITRNLTKIRELVKNGFTYIRVQTGQKLYFANLEVETLFTQSNHNPQRIVTLNDASVIQRLSFLRTADTYGEARTVDHVSAAASSKTSLISTGDAYRWSGRWIAAMYGTYLKADMVTVSHHGGAGLTMGVYDLISPRVVWWPTGKSQSGEYKLATNWQGKVNQHIMYDIDSVEYMYTSDYYHITLVLKEAGPYHDGIYHAIDKTAISHYVASKADLKTGSANEFSARSEMYAAYSVAIKKI